MPRLRAPPSLETSACTMLAGSLAKACARLEEQEGEEGEQVVEELLDHLPVALLERATHQVVELLTSQAGTRGTGPGWAYSRVRGGTAASFPGLPTALRLLPRPQTSRLDLGALFASARLSRSLTGQCRTALAAGLARCRRLASLQLRSKCSDLLLAMIGASCPLLQDLNISLSEQVSDTGLSSLLPCSALACLDLLKCWNISPPGVADLLLGLPRLRRLHYANMKAVLEAVQARPESGPFPGIEVFDSTEYCLAVPGQGTRPPEEAEVGWLAGPASLTAVAAAFPAVSTVRLLVSDQEARHLTALPRLVHIELELSDDPAAGLLHLLTAHPNRARFGHLFLQVGPLQAAHLLALSANCPALRHFRLIGFQLQDAASLASGPAAFPSLTHLNISLYDDEMESSDEDEEEEAANAPRHTLDVMDYFLRSATNLEVVSLHMNWGLRLDLPHLLGLLDRNPLAKTTGLHLSSPGSLLLGEEAARALVGRLPSLASLRLTGWDMDTRAIARLTEEAHRENLDITYL